MKITLNSEADTKNLAERVWKNLQGGMTVALIGQLGAGKTTFVRYVGEVAGSQVPVHSPSFVLSHEYDTSGQLFIEHWDLYRLGAAPAELKEPPSSMTVRIIEWADKDKQLLAECDLKIEFAIIDATSRGIHISGSPDLLSAIQT